MSWPRIRTSVDHSQDAMSRGYRQQHRSADALRRLGYLREAEEVFRFCPRSG